MVTIMGRLINALPPKSLQFAHLAAGGAALLHPTDSHSSEIAGILHRTQMSYFIH
jgi:hypothetical protein